MIPRNFQGKRILFLSDISYHATQLQSFTNKQFLFTSQNHKVCPELYKQMNIQVIFMEEWNKEVRRQLYYTERNGEPDLYRFRLS